MQSRAPLSQDLVLVGGGHAHVHVLKNFGMRPVAGVRVTLIAREVETPYSGMLPGYVAGRYGFAECHIDLGRLARFAGARLIHDEAIGLDRGAPHVTTMCRAPPSTRPRSSRLPGSRNAGRRCSTAPAISAICGLRWSAAAPA